jgi:hypothetical protein
MNEKRAEWANAALDTFQETTNTDDQDVLSDLLCDLMHWADRHLTDGHDFDSELSRARYHYAEEIAEVDMMKEGDDSK